MLSLGRVPNDERKGRRLGDETKGRIADLASGWTVDGDSPPPPERPVRRESVGAARPGLDRPRRHTKTSPPPPPGSAERKALEGKIAELTDELEDELEPAHDSVDDDDSNLIDVAPLWKGQPPPMVPLAAVPAGRSVSPAGSTGRVPLLGAVRGKALPTGRAPLASRGIDGALVGGSTTENRGAIGVNHDGSGSLSTNAASGTIGGDTPPPVFDRKPPAGSTGPSNVRAKPGPDDSSQEATTVLAAAGSTPRLTVPVGEFDHGQTIFEQDKLRAAYSQATNPRAAPGAPPPETWLDPTVENDRHSAAFSEPSIASTKQYGLEELRLAGVIAEPTEASSVGVESQGGVRGDATTLSPPSPGHAAAGTLRTMAALRRRPGITGDLRYVATVVLGLRSAARELAELEGQQAKRQQSRRHHQVALGRTAVALAEARGPADANEHHALGPAREQLARIDDERSQHAARIIAADAELGRLRVERDATAARHIAELAALDAQLAAFTEQLEPLHKQAVQVRRRGVNLHEAVVRIDAKLVAAEISLASGDGKIDPAAVQVEIATLKAERKAIQSDEPAIAGELDALNPQIAGIEAARQDAVRRRAELVSAEREDQLRVDELMVAIGAQRKVVDRAAAATEVARDKVLFQLGERLCVDRPDGLAPQLAPIDEIDVELGVADRRIMELRELQSSVDPRKVARGVAYLAVAVAVVGALAIFVVDRWLTALL